MKKVGNLCFLIILFIYWRSRYNKKFIDWSFMQLGICCQIHSNQNIALGNILVLKS